LSLLALEWLMKRRAMVRGPYSEIRLICDAETSDSAIFLLRLPVS